MNVNIWGPSAWEILHNAAFLLDIESRESQLFFLLNDLLPCIYCLKSYREFYIQLGPPAKEMYSQWIYKIHSLVNKKLNNQRIDKLIAKDPRLKILHQFRDDFVIEPSELVVKKRFMVNREDPLPWRDSSVMLLSFTMAATTPEVFTKLKLFIKELKALDPKRSQIYNELEQMPSAEALRTKLEQIKYKDLSFSKYSPRQITELIRAHTCFEGSCY